MQEKLSEITRIQQGEPGAAEVAAAQDAINQRTKKVGVLSVRVVDPVEFAPIRDAAAVATRLGCIPATAMGCRPIP